MSAATEWTARALGMGARAAEARKEHMENLESEARDELIRSGVPPDAANGDEPLILGAVTTYLLSQMGSGKEAERMGALWEVKLDSLRKSSRLGGTNGLQ